MTKTNLSIYEHKRGYGFAVACYRRVMCWRASQLISYSVRLYNRDGVFIGHTLVEHPRNQVEPPYVECTHPDDAPQLRQVRPEGIVADTTVRIQRFVRFQEGCYREEI